MKRHNSYSGRYSLWARGDRLYLRHEDDEPGRRRRITERVRSTHDLLHD
jgi:hypothetical protein